MSRCSLELVVATREEPNFSREMAQLRRLTSQLRLSLFSLTDLPRLRDAFQSSMVREATRLPRRAVWDSMASAAADGFVTSILAIFARAAITTNSVARSRRSTGFSAMFGGCR